MELRGKFSKNLKLLMADSSISQSELARRTGIARTTICSYINMTNEPTLSNIYKIVKELGCTFEDLVE